MLTDNILDLIGNTPLIRLNGRLIEGLTRPLRL